MIHHAYARRVHVRCLHVVKFEQTPDGCVFIVEMEAGGNAPREIVRDDDDVVAVSFPLGDVFVAVSLPLSYKVVPLTYSGVGGGFDMAHEHVHMAEIDLFAQLIEMRAENLLGLVGVARCGNVSTLRWANTQGRYG